MQARPKCYGAVADDGVGPWSSGGVVDRRQLSGPQGRFYTNFERWWASRGACCLVGLFRFFVPVLLCPCRVLVLAIPVSVGTLGFGARGPLPLPPAARDMSVIGIGL